MIIQPKTVNENGLDMAEGQALSFWINQKERKELGLEARMFQTAEACKFIDDVNDGLELWCQSCRATQATWKYIKGSSALHNRDTRIANGVDVVKQRLRKEVKKVEFSSVWRRLQDQNDPCIDILGDGTKVGTMDEKAQAKETAEHFSKVQTYECRLSAMNDYLKYFGNGTFYLLAGGSGTGKTNLALQAFELQKVLYIGLDMTMPDVVKRVWEINAYSRFPEYVPYQQMRMSVAAAWDSAKTSYDRIIERLMPNLVMVDVSAITIEQLFYTVASEITAGRKPDCVIVDYVDKVECEGKFDSVHEKRKHIGRKMKELAKVHNVGILGLVQYNSNFEPYKVGQANWIQGSRDLIATSDGCICIWRSKAQNMESNQEMPDLSHIWVSNSLKNRSTGYMDDQRIDVKGLYLMDAKKVAMEW